MDARRRSSSTKRSAVPVPFPGSAAGHHRFAGEVGYGGEQKAAEIGKAAFGLLRGLLGGRGGGGGGGSPWRCRGDKPSLADDPIRAKQTFADPGGAAAIKVGANTGRTASYWSASMSTRPKTGRRPPGQLERLKPLADGGWVTCRWPNPSSGCTTKSGRTGGPRFAFSATKASMAARGARPTIPAGAIGAVAPRLLESGTLPADQIPVLPGVPWAPTGLAAPARLVPCSIPVSPWWSASRRLSAWWRHVTQPGGSG